MAAKQERGEGAEEGGGAGRGGPIRRSTIYDNEPALRVTIIRRRGSQLASGDRRTIVRGMVMHRTGLQENTADIARLPHAGFKVPCRQHQRGAGGAAGGDGGWVHFLHHVLGGVRDILPDALAAMGEAAHRGAASLPERGGDVHFMHQDT